MVNWTANIWDARAHDGKSRTHVPAQPVWSAFGMRVVQLLLAFIILVMTAYAADQFGTSGLAGFGLAWFTFILTLGYIIYLAVSLFVTPQIYNYWAQLVLESLLVIFWLCTWAVLASEAAQLSPFDDYYGYYYGGNWKSAVNCMKASAALGALLWVTFIITLVFFVLSLLSHRKTAAGTAGPVSDKPIADGPMPVEMQNQQPAYPQQTYAQQQQPLHQDSPYETQQTYPVDHQQQQSYPAEHHQQQQQTTPYPVEQPQQAYAVPEQQQQQAYGVPETRQPHQQV
ncbi:hypothetical protein GE09DRAFT_1249905 [Coniochaeta sp. 2T2.1]|nr:hypothetical protein GE09DRAFT_1249905 [Coniochaeta sp. 2T2.1]